MKEKKERKTTNNVVHKQKNTADLVGLFIKDVWKKPIQMYTE